MLNSSGILYLSSEVLVSNTVHKTQFNCLSFALSWELQAGGIFWLKLLGPWFLKLDIHVWSVLPKLFFYFVSVSHFSNRGGKTVLPQTGTETVQKQILVGEFSKHHCSKVQGVKLWCPVLCLEPTLHPQPEAQHCSFNLLTLDESLSCCVSPFPNNIAIRLIFTFLTATQ